MLKFVVDVGRPVLSPEEMKLLEKLRIVVLHMPSWITWDQNNLGGLFKITRPHPGSSKNEWGFEPGNPCFYETTALKDDCLDWNKDSNFPNNHNLGSKRWGRYGLFERCSKAKGL